MQYGLFGGVEKEVKWRRTLLPQRKARHLARREKDGWRAKKRRIVNQAKAKPCEDCGVEYPPFVMDLHHVNGKKSFAISDYKAGGVPKLKAEIAKCVVLCANCHRLRHGRVVEKEEAEVDLFDLQ